MPFAVFDIETRIDKRLLNQVFFAGEKLGDQEAYEKFGEQLTKGSGRGFFPTSLHVPISIAVGNVTDDYVLRSVESLAAPTIRSPIWCAISGRGPSVSPDAW